MLPLTNPIKTRTFSLFGTRFLRLSDIWSHIYGIATVIALAIAIVTGFLVHYGKIKVELQSLNLLLICVITMFLFVFLLSYVYYHKNLRALNELPLKNHILNNYCEQQEITILRQTECCHNILSYFRNLMDDIDKYLEGGQFTDFWQFARIIDDFRKFLEIVTSHLQSYYTLITSDNCSITIKLFDRNHKVKTYWRDMVNLRKRAITDGNNFGAFDIEDNTAIKYIMDSGFYDSFFVCDHLDEEFKIHKYKNPHQWEKHYNATAVVPICRSYNQTQKRNIIGFLCVDNFKGGLTHAAIYEFLFFVADLLYNPFIKLNKLVGIANSQNFQHEEVKKYNNGNFS